MVRKHNRRAAKAAYAISIGVAAADERRLQRGEATVDGVDCFANPHAQVGRNLIVAAAGGVDFAPHIAQAIDQCAFDVHMDVFQLDLELEASLLNFLADVVQTLLNLLAFVGCEQPDVR